VEKHVGIAKIFEDVFGYVPEADSFDFPHEVRSTKDRDLQIVAGFVYAMERGHGIVITNAMNTYHLPARLIAENGLATGDYIEAFADDYCVQSIAKQSDIKPNASGATRPFRQVLVGDLRFKLGQRIVIQGKNKFDFVEYMSRFSLPKTKKIALLIDESDDCMTYLEEAGFEKVFLSRVNHNLKKRVMLALYALFISKQMCAKGEDVILFVDSFNKLFRIYNATFSNSEKIEIAELHVGPYMDLKSFFMEAKQSANAGSLTIISNIVEPVSEIEKYVVGEFIEMCSVISPAYENASE